MLYRPPIRVRPSLKRAGTVLPTQKPVARQEEKKLPEPVDFAKLVEVYEKMPGMLEQMEAARKELLAAHAEVLKKTGGVQASFEKVKRGEPGKPGRDAQIDLEDMARRVATLMPKPKDGKDADPIDEKRIAKRAAKYVKLPVVENGKDADPDTTLQKIVEMLKTGDIKIHVKNVEGLEQTIAPIRSLAVKNGGIRGGGDTVTAGTNVTITTNGSGQKVINATGGAGLSVIVVTGTIDDSNKSFAAATQPTLLNINGAFYLKTGGAYTWSYSGTTITLNQPVGTGGSIFGI